MKRRKRRRARSLKSKIVVALVVFATLAWGVQVTYRFLRTPTGHLVAALLSVVVVAVAFFKVRRAWLRRQQIARVIVSTDRRDYIIETEDYRRGSPKENHYRKVMQLTLLAAFGNVCAKCGADDNGLDLDHFFLPKNEGGSFIMRHRNGSLINNAIPLCASCNRRKSDRALQDFFAAPELVRILRVNVGLTRRLNQRRLLDARGEISRRSA